MIQSCHPAPGATVHARPGSRTRVARPDPARRKIRVVPDAICLRRGLAQARAHCFPDAAVASCRSAPSNACRVCGVRAMRHATSCCTAMRRQARARTRSYRRLPPGSGASAAFPGPAPACPSRPGTSSVAAAGASSGSRRRPAGTGSASSGDDTRAGPPAQSRMAVLSAGTQTWAAYVFHAGHELLRESAFGQIGPCAVAQVHQRARGDLPAVVIRQALQVTPQHGRHQRLDLRAFAPVPGRTASSLAQASRNARRPCWPASAPRFIVMAPSRSAMARRDSRTCCRARSDDGAQHVSRRQNAPRNRCPLPAGAVAARADGDSSRRACSPAPHRRRLPT